jgi:alpha-mannosidase
MNKSLYVTLILFYFFAKSYPQSDLPTRLPDLEKEKIVSGYNRTISGLAFQYASPIPSVHRALLCRATSGTMQVAWQTNPVPETIEGPFVYFIWACGLGCNLGQKSFVLEINQKKIVTFQSRPDSIWQVSAEQGIELSFISTIVDQYKDRFGFMYLRYPIKLLPVQRFLNLRVTGEKTGSPAWFMVFEKSINTEPFIYDEQVLIKKADGMHQQVAVEMIHLGKAADLALSFDDSSVARTRLTFGSNLVHLFLPAVRQDQSMQLKLDITGRPLQTIEYTLKPVRKKEIHLLHHTHLDIGYTHHQPTSNGCPKVYGR